MFLGANPEGRGRAGTEVENILLARPFEACEEYSLAAHLATIPLETWEKEAPVLDAILRETLRIAQPHAAMRRNTGPDLHVGDKVIPAGSYVIYPFSDVHLNEKFYPDPWLFDPGRNHDKGTWIGWGSGASRSISSFGHPLTWMVLNRSHHMSRYSIG